MRLRPSLPSHQGGVSISSTNANTQTATIQVRVNERPCAVAAGTMLFGLRDRMKPEADVLIRNGFPFRQDCPLEEGDEIVLIRRGETPSAEEMEALLVARHGPGVHEKVKRARIGIAGCGGLGSAVAVALTRTGVGRLLLVDFDVIEPSNLNRQQFFVDQIGRKKTEALAENLKRMNPYVTIETRDMALTRDNIPEVFAGCNVVAECFDDPQAKREMTVAMRTKMPEMPLVTVSGIAGYGPAGKIGVRRIFNNIYLVGDRETAAGPGRGLLAPRVAVAAGHQANLILRLLLGESLGEDL
jgi:sulfur carrier protein ThiS adenylyltransferase